MCQEIPEDSSEEDGSCVAPGSYIRRRPSSQSSVHIYNQQTNNIGELTFPTEMSLTRTEFSHSLTGLRGTETRNLDYSPRLLHLDYSTPASLLLSVERILQ